MDIGYIVTETNIDGQPIRKSLNLEKFIKDSFDTFVREHRDSLHDAFHNQEYDEIPDIPEYDRFLDELGPKVYPLADKVGMSKDDADSLIDFYYLDFYRNVLPYT